ncbi:hypothetical protein L249_3258 [Ophiocordyceps polyrhachis-furcata BCC 54312]|uniref:DUF1783-domain-containing protein n=1 Tax=Ophiocordyceps polyrhachis-furcata BCC 54312 TaxID=1330021 RepID=A0A367LRP0_9HYPO|nr:hypothetical protein L249_3258 [Ophiocordyceps polyrhachis-furcata BCC 54312]
MLMRMAWRGTSKMTTTTTTTTTTVSLSRRWMMVAAPKKGDGPLMTRRADRMLPELAQIRTRTWRRTLPLFALTMALSSIAIFNYQKTSSPVVSAVLYALRTSPLARDLLGNDIYFRRAMPWISGELNQLHGRVDISFAVKGDKSHGLVRFVARRETPGAPFVTHLWSLAVAADGGRGEKKMRGEDGVVDLLREARADPFADLLKGHDDGDDDDEVGVGEVAETRGFRQGRMGR